MKFAFYTLGCKTNQFETQAMERLLTQAGHTLGSFDEDCDAYIVNTCSVTAVADKKNRAVLRRCRRAHPNAVLGVCGCYSQRAPELLRELGADVVGGSGNHRQFLQDVLAALDGRTSRGTPDNALRRREFEVLPAGGLAERTRALLKVQDGCVNFCSYCIIPFTRGPVRSMPADIAAQQAQLLEAAGYREIVITGIEVASWGVDLPGKPSPAELIARVCRAAPSLRIRLGSLEPRVVTEDFCRRLAELPNLCPQFHLSMQSGCDSVLRRMNRRYDTARFLESVRLLRAAFPGCAITTDMIVAFPGETEEEFAESLRFIRKCDFSAMHIFPYSRRPGTAADKLPGQLDNAVKEARSRAAIAAAEEMNLRYRRGLLGTVQQVLFETQEDGLWSGHAPNYVRVYARGEMLHNQVRDVLVRACVGDGVVGDIV